MPPPCPVLRTPQWATVAADRRRVTAVGRGLLPSYGVSAGDTPSARAGDRPDEGPGVVLPGGVARARLDDQPGGGEQVGVLGGPGRREADVVLPGDQQDRDAQRREGGPHDRGVGHAVAVVAGGRVRVALPVGAGGGRRSGVVPPAVREGR